MANSAIFMGWTRPASGQGAKAMALYLAMMNYLRTLHAEGRIDSFEPVLLGSNGTDLSGFVMVRGERTKLDEVRNSPKFRELTVRGSVALVGFRVIRAHMGRELEQLLASYQRVMMEG